MNPSAYMVAELSGPAVVVMEAEVAGVAGVAGVAEAGQATMKRQLIIMTGWLISTGQSRAQGQRRAS